MYILRTSVLLFASCSALCVAASAADAKSCPSLVIVNARDKQGDLAPGLRSTSFRVRVGDETVMVSSVQAATGVHRVVLLVDVSGSVSKESRTWQIARAAANNLLEDAPPTLRVALVLFSDHIIDTIGFDRPTRDIVDRITNLEVGKGRTALLDSLKYAAQLLGTPEPGDMVYVITDGGDNVSKTKQKDVENSLLVKGIRLFAFVLLSRFSSLIPDEQSGQLVLLDLSKVTGGLVVNADFDASLDAQRQLNTELRRAYDQMSHFYLLQFAIPAPWTKKESLHIDVVDEYQKKRRDISTSYPRNLLPCDRY